MIRQPNSILGNRQLLVTMGKKGELFGFFYPGRDFAQHLEESQSCLYDGHRLIWSNDHEWHVSQRYFENTNIVNTELVHPCGLKMHIRDFIHTDQPIMVRNYSITSHGGFHGKFFYYSNFKIGEMQKKNSAFCDHDAGMLVQYWKDYHIGISSRPVFEEWQIGKALDTIWWTNAKYDMEDGELQNNREDIGNINNAIGWKLDIDAGSTAEITIFISAASTRLSLYGRIRDIRNQTMENMLNETQESGIKWLSRKTLLELKDLPGFESVRLELMEAFNRSLLTLSILNDPVRGSFVAAPEFDHDFEKSGGYGYCWNRDSSEIVIALLNAGYPEYCERFFRWCKKTQLPDGSWFQRYWLDGNAGSSWGNFSHSTQIDETGSTLFAMESYYSSLEPVLKREFLDRIWATVLSAAEYLMRRTPEGMHEPCICLWETYSGIFTYTNAAIYGGLVGAAQMAKDYNEMDLASRWLERAELIKQQTIKQLWLPEEGYFARGIAHNGRIDKDIDASILGTFVPFNMLSADDENERAMIHSMIGNIESRLRVRVNDHFGIKRYEDDTYIDGNPWVVTTLWLSKAMLSLAGSIKGVNDGTEKNEEWKIMTTEALEYIRWSLRGTTSAGMLPEQVNKHTGRPAWAIPLCWSCALMLENIVLLDGLK
ncbi:glycoside hydrolase family 15 protein [Methanolobus halotolerans]|uniref:Glucan 1,4-alpha-glucosidase n=1 Tax=Methanolobus halotolerans TaxID=2052935 RepID=A0A4E0PYV5_9EURY|nr:glycoside hydrolase family 15 protein [Methanolobus halotolerans]TGC11532.1 glucan 1,4-alpha-glucosidase [Methanolobus halotolerans]